MLGRTTAQGKIAKLKKRVRVVQGGTSASKTFSILPILITYAIKVPNLHITVVSESYPHLRRGAIKDFKAIMRMTDNWRVDSFNVSSASYTFDSGSVIEFLGADKPDKLRGARRDILFVNEANNIPWEAYQQLAIRTSKFIYIDFNPSHEFWVHTELEGEDDVDWLTLTYKDNEACPPEVVKELEKNIAKAEKSEYWKNWVDVYVYGRLGSRQGVIFKEHQAWNKIGKVPANARLIGYGLDFGYTNDPSSIVVGYRYNGELIFDEVCYQTLMSNTDLANKIKNNTLKRAQGWADSAEPKSIDFLRSAGINVDGVKKGADSIRYGIGLLLQEKFYVTDRSTNLIKELRDYSYKEKDGKTFNEPESNQRDHAIDAMRYLRMMMQGNERSELIFV